MSWRRDFKLNIFQSTHLREVRRYFCADAMDKDGFQSTHLREVRLGLLLGSIIYLVLFQSTHLREVRR